MGNESRSQTGSATESWLLLPGIYMIDVWSRVPLFLGQWANPGRAGNTHFFEHFNGESGPDSF